VHAGVVGVIAGWSIGSWAGVVVGAATMLALVVVVRRRAGRCGANQFAVSVGSERTP